MSVIDLRYLRMGTSADLSAANLVLTLGQPGYEVDTSRIKVGDGNTAWSGLAYLANGASGSGGIDGGTPGSSYGGTASINGGTP